MQSYQYFVVLVLTFLIAFQTACQKDEAIEPQTAEFGRCDHFDPLRQPFFGDTHVHTNLSFDANLRGTRTGHREAYAFAKGGEIGLMPYDEDGNPLRTLKAERPIDFVSISDHSEFLGMVSLCEDPDSVAYDTSMCRYFQDGGDGDEGFSVVGTFLFNQGDHMVHPELCGDDNRHCVAQGAEVWEEIQQEAEAAYDRSSACDFTSFIAYEWTGSPGTLNLHRNVIFRNEVVPDQPTSYLDAAFVEDLWKGLQDTCTGNGSGCDVLTIPHNSNLSSGLFFKNEMKDKEPFTPAYAAMRNKMEPIIEIYQHKGSSECLFGTLNADEFCSFEIVNYNTFASGLLPFPKMSENDSYLRYGYGRGMQLQKNLGTNPFRHGIVASTDTHLSIPGEIRESNFPGHGGAGQSNSNATSVTEAIPALADSPYNSAGGLAAVWAEENSREGIFRAMKRREAFGTSGPRIVPRFFGGWDLPADLCGSTELAKVGYEKGVPMGGLLQEAPGEQKKPTFVVSALQDPGTSDAPGTPLQRIQIVKGWLDENGEYKVEAYTLNDDADNGASVDINTCEQSGTGHAQLCSTWTDENFDANQNAYYYARVIENPSCRWTTLACLDKGYDCANPQTDMDKACCHPRLGLNRDHCAAVSCEDDPENECCELPVQPVIQERAWTSPIWYEPPAAD